MESKAGSIREAKAGVKPVSERTIKKIYADGGTVLVLDDKKSEVWTILCPTCNTIHTARSRLCPSCVKDQITVLNRRNLALMDQNESLREFITALRGELFKEWHEQAKKEGLKSPDMVVERRWREVLKEVGF